MIATTRYWQYSRGRQAFCDLSVAPKSCNPAEFFGTGAEG
jgi:hypothetical protein